MPHGTSANGYYRSSRKKDSGNAYYLVFRAGRNDASGNGSFGMGLPVPRTEIALPLSAFSESAQLLGPVRRFLRPPMIPSTRVSVSWV
ncbi:hypothetical protein IJ380_02775 [Candidatus Saccharibacteria bacterium]|nr:hypothetical protein [Candidatus Saccharibacteria bacterium]